MFGWFKKPKLVKLRTLSENGKYGIAATSLKDLLKKGSTILQVPLPGSRICLYEDGTEVTEDYFTHLAVNTELVLLTEGQSWKGFASDIGLLLGFSDRHTEILIKSAQDLLADEHSEKRRKILRDLLHNLKDNSQAEEREADKDWFQGIESRFKTKSAYMKFNCESRVRGYMRDVEKYTSSIKSAKEQKEYREIAELMAEELKSSKYNGCYFDRTEKDSNRLCTKGGWFSCQGAFDQDKCSSLHSINPYGTRESRILFSTWNLDHRIEKKRTIIPTLAKALRGHNSSDINWKYFYGLLFTVENLRLVHIVCHKKCTHSLTCDSSKIYKKRKKKEQ